MAHQLMIHRDSMFETSDDMSILTEVELKMEPEGELKSTRTIPK